MYGDIINFAHRAILILLDTSSWFFKLKLLKALEVVKIITCIRAFVPSNPFK